MYILTIVPFYFADDLKFDLSCVKKEAEMQSGTIIPNLDDSFEEKMLRYANSMCLFYTVQLNFVYWNIKKTRTPL